MGVGDWGLGEEGVGTLDMSGHEPATLNFA